MKLLKKPLALAAAAALGAGLVSVIGAPAASADSGNFLTFSNPAGTVTSDPTKKLAGRVVAGHACSAAAQTYFAVILASDAPVGSNFPAVGGLTVVSGNPAGAGQKNTATGFTFQADDTIDGQISSNPGSSFPVGLYKVTLTCQDGSGNATDTFTGSFSVTTAASAGVSGAYNGADLSAAVATTTTITAPAAASTNATVGTAVSLTATVSPAAAAGTVQFKDGATNIGSPVTVSGGTASGSFTVPSPATTSSITAVFTPANGPVFPAAGFTTQYAGSTSAAKSIVGQITTTSVAVPTVSAGPYNAITPVTVSTLVGLASTPATPAGAPGTVVFQNTSQGNASIGTVTYNSVTGVATFTGTLPAGTYTLRAVFTSGSVGFTDAGPSADAASFTVVTVGVTEKIVTTIAAGALNIAVAGNPTIPDGISTQPADNSNPTNTVDLGTAVLDGSGNYFQSSNDMIPVVVIDTRAGDPGYDVRGQVTDFARTSGTGGTTTSINGANLFWAPAPYLAPKLNGAPIGVGYSTGSLRPNVVLTPGTNLTAAQPSGASFVPVQVGDSSKDSAGLKASQRLYNTAANNGTGTAKYGATLTLRVPTNTAAGTYQATLTLTAV